MVVRTLDGQKIVTGDRQLGDSKASVDFTTSVRVPPGTYMVRLAVMDGAGRVGSVDHLVDARPVPLGGVAVTGPLLVQLPPDDHGEPHFTVDGVRQGERLAMEVGLTGNSVPVENLEVGFEIATTADGPALIQEPAKFSPERGPRSVLAQAVTDVSMLPPGKYYARVKVKSGVDPIGEVRRAFRVLGGQEQP